VKMLKEMLDKSRSDGVNDRVIYAKFKCWCDQNIQEKEASIKKLTKLILIIEARIGKLMAENGKLSIECAGIKDMIGQLKAAIKLAEELRDKENTIYIVEEKDYKAAIAQCEEAIKTLAEVGADQTLSGGQEHKQYMAGMGLTELKARVQSALLAASALAPKEDKRKITSFLQAPFTGTYSAQSGEVVGILKNMLDTFKANLVSVISVEEKAVIKFKAFIQVKIASVGELKIQYEKKQEIMGENDEELASLRIQLEEAQAKLKDDEEFLAKTKALCEIKAKEYEKRKQFRANEEAAIAEAIAILDSDAAFETFGKTSATTGGYKGGKGAASLLQLASSRRVVAASELETRSSAYAILSEAARKSGSARIANVAVLLETGNPFQTVLDKIDEIVALIDEEGEADEKNYEWCNSEREENDKVLEAHKEAIKTLKTEISDLDILINDPETGLLVQITETETSIKENHDSQVSKTADRGVENKDYQTNIKNVVAAQDVLRAAMKVLTEYYASMKKAADAEFFQQEPPSTWDAEEATKGGFKGQKEQGNKVIEMLEFILEESEKEEMHAHSTEKEAQHEFEDEMADLKKEEADLMANLAELRATLAEKEADLEMKKKDLAKETAGKIATEDYLAKIKPGCDFITENIEVRKSSRLTEKKALKKAKALLKGSPAYKAAVEKAKIEGWGECKGKCLGAEEHVECKACLAKVTIPGYCAGHPDTEGC